MQSIITKDLEHCYVCKRYGVEIHHIFFGNKNRDLSDKYKLLVPLCHEHHQGKYGVHKNREVDLSLKIIGQKAFEMEYPDEDFLKTFGRNYL